MFGLSDEVNPNEVYAWSIFNFICYALLPYWVFRRRGYSNQQLCLRSSDLPNDILVIVCVLGIVFTFDLRGNPVRQLNGHQLATGSLKEASDMSSTRDRGYVASPKAVTRA